MFSLLSLPSLTCPTHNDIYIPSAPPRLTIDILSAEKKNSLHLQLVATICMFSLASFCSWFDMSFHLFGRNLDAYFNDH